MNPKFTIQDIDSIVDKYDHLFDEKRINRASGQRDRYRDANEREKTAEGTRRAFEQEERREIARQTIMEVMQTEEWKTANAQKNRDLAKDPEFLRRLREGILANIEKYERAAQAKWDDPEFRARNNAARNAVQQTEEYKRNHAEGVRRTVESETWRRNVEKANKDPERRAKHSASVSGEKSHNFMGAFIGTHVKNGAIVRVCGAKDAVAQGFHYSGIFNCAAGKPGYKTHKGYTWQRETLA